MSDGVFFNRIFVQAIAFMGIGLCITLIAALMLVIIILGRLIWMRES